MWVGLNEDIRAIHAQQPTFRATVDLVNFGVAVVDKQGKPVTGLTAEDFQVLENGKPQSLKYFAAGDPEDAPPLHIGLLLDTSGSMAGDIKDSRTAAVTGLALIRSRGIVVCIS